MYEKLNELIEAEEELKVMIANAPKDLAIQHMYWFGNLIKINLEKFEIVEISYRSTVHSNYYLVIKVDGATYDVSELVAHAFVSLICWARDSKINLNACAETALRLFVSVYERLENNSTKEEIFSGLQIAIKGCVETIMGANKARKKKKKK